MLVNINVEALYHGNCDQSDAEYASSAIMDAFSTHGIRGLSRDNFPNAFITKAPSSSMMKGVSVPTKDKKDPNTAVELYFQVGPDNLSERVLIDLLAQIMYEPLYDQVRTKDQFGYQVSVDVKWTFGVMGLCLKVVSSAKKSVEV